jgi:hypothetical protein
VPANKKCALWPGCPAAGHPAATRGPLPLLFRTHNPARNDAVPARPQIPMITKTLPPFFRVKAFAIMKITFLFELRSGRAHAIPGALNRQHD